jgi:hypothetical protein
MKPSIVALMLLGGAGCMHYQPVGPLAKQMGGPRPAQQPSAGVRVTPVKDAAAVPILPPAPPPSPPSVMVTPGDVTGETTQQAAARLTEEMDSDRKAMDRMPGYAEVSVVKGRRP